MLGDDGERVILPRRVEWVHKVRDGQGPSPGDPHHGRSPAHWLHHSATPRTLLLAPVGRSCPFFVFIAAAGGAAVSATELSPSDALMLLELRVGCRSVVACLGQGARPLRGDWGLVGNGGLVGCSV